MTGRRPFQEVQILPKKENEYSARIKGAEKRGIEQRFIAQERGFDFFDGERENGYGGFVYDGRWAEIARKLFELGQLSPKSRVLQMNCEKGFLLLEFQKLEMDLQLVGLESSRYALENTVSGLKSFLLEWKSPELPFFDNSIDLLIAIGYPYTLTLPDFVCFLRECNRTSKLSFITLACYDDALDYSIFKKWSLLGVLLFRREEWRYLLSQLEFRGYVQFIDANFLGLCGSESDL
jgi:hypothetical protein